jgi:hypothetical protein
LVARRAAGRVGQADDEGDRVESLRPQLSQGRGTRTFDELSLLVPADIDWLFVWTVGALQDVFIVDSGPQLWAWVGRGASVNERRSALHYAHVYLKEQKRPIELPLTRIGQGQEPNEFWQAFAA